MQVIFPNTRNKFPNKKYQIFAGIDPGTETGIAIWDKKAGSFVEVTTQKIHVVMEYILKLHSEHGENLLVRVEDARQRKWFGNTGDEMKQGAGSIKRDSSIWEDFLVDKGISFQMIAPAKNKTKLSKEQFIQITGYSKRTSQHARDAAMLVFNF